MIASLYADILFSCSDVIASLLDFKFYIAAAFCTLVVENFSENIFQISKRDYERGVVADEFCVTDVERGAVAVS